MHIYLEEPRLVKCKKCGNFILPHTVCPFCGYYKGEMVVDVLAKLEEKERKKREKRNENERGNGKSKDQRIEPRRTFKEIVWLQAGIYQDLLQCNHFMSGIFTNRK